MKKLGFDLYEGKPSEVGNKDNNNLFCEVERNNAGNVIKFKSILFSDGTPAAGSSLPYDAVACTNLRVAVEDDDIWLIASSVPSGVTSLLLPEGATVGDGTMLQDYIVDCTNPVTVGDYEAFALPNDVWEQQIG